MSSRPLLSFAERRDSGAMRGVDAPPFLRVDVAGRRAFLNGFELGLDRARFDLLAAFAALPVGAVMTKEQAYEAMHPRDAPETYHRLRSRTVESHVSRLRSELRHARPDWAWLPNVWGVGYRLVEQEIVLELVGAAKCPTCGSVLA